LFAPGSLLPRTQAQYPQRRKHPAHRCFDDLGANVPDAILKSLLQETFLMGESRLERRNAEQTRFIARVEVAHVTRKSFFELFLVEDAESVAYSLFEPFYI